MYRDYEDYMQSVLGYNIPNTYNNINYYETRRNTPNLQEINKLYPEIYGIIYPIIQKICRRKSINQINEDELSKMVNEIYNVVETENNTEDETRRKNGRNKKFKNKRN